MERNRSPHIQKRTNMLSSWHFFNNLGVTMKRLALFALLVPMLLAAEEQTHIAIGSRSMNEEAAAQVQSERGTPAEEEEASLEAAGFIFDQYPPVYYSNAHHRLTAITEVNHNECTLELEDSSVWKISSYDAKKALNWRSNDPLAITQNTRWFSRYNYRIINLSNGSSVEADLFLGPAELGRYSRFITAIDHYRREIMLSDNSRWEISYLDSSIFKDWAKNDYLIIGTNSNTSFWDSAKDTLLINVNMNNSARAQQF